MKKFIFSFLIVGLVGLMVLLIAPVRNTQGKLKAYYGGDALSYDGYVVVATTNSGSLELFKWKEGGNFVKFASFKSFDDRFSVSTDFYSTVLHVENGNLYVYAVDGWQIHKYEIVNLSSVRLVNKQKDNMWDWFGSLTVIDDKVASTGSRGLKIWNNDLQVIDSYKMPTTDNSYNVTNAGSKKYLFTVADGKIRIFDRESRTEIRTVPIEFKWNSEWYKRAIYNDKVDNAMYVVDDEAVRKINLTGEIEKSFYHISNLGYDVIPSIDGKNIYFSDGVGVVKLRKSDLAVIDYYFSNKLTDSGWSMGIKSVMTDSGEKLVVFNNTGIVMLDSSLNPVKMNEEVLTIAATELDFSPQISEPLFLKVDKNRVSRNGTILLSGGGYGANETLDVFLGDTQITSLAANEFGRFNQEVTITTDKPGKKDIKVRGQISKLSYSLGLDIE